jgi:hypothetical protein
VGRYSCADAEAAARQSTLENIQRSSVMLRVKYHVLRCGGALT